MYFIGQTRFSLYIPKSNVWNVSNFTEQEYIAHLFSDERMSVRAKIFAEISLPIMAKMQKQFDFLYIVLYSSILPEKWKNMLFDLQKKYPFLYLCESDNHPENPIYTVLKDKKDGSVAFFRLDDDDLLSVDYLENLAKYNTKAYKNMAVSFGKGIAAFYKDDNYIDFRNVVQKYPSMGQAYIGYWENGNLELPPMYSHHNLDQNIPVIVDSRNIMYLQTYHKQQDTHYRFSQTANTENISIEAELAKYPRSENIEELEKAFPTLKYSIQNFVENKEYYYQVNDIEILDKNTSFHITNPKVKNLYEGKYKIVSSEKAVSPKAFLISFTFDRDVKVISGLSFSNYNNIGWFKYLNCANGVCSDNLCFTLDQPAKLSQVKIVVWDERFQSSHIELIEIA
ncbi:glycosyltransferase [Neisseria canis]|uniref:Protein of uncharacterized function (DUF3118) n=1 Tax=Neisseria canis TaxID=493 RepID=A0A448D7A0_9NEIS|nr:glycosyltransferase [Neisseria canis]OSI09332.1 hypothetical protein BWD07_11690 [Neisseria canis]VEF00306.1 Protein of uncharacterised function (DUF3118) [Neisseria canis]